MKQSIYKRILVAMIVGAFTVTPVSTDAVFAAEENVNGSQIEAPADEQAGVSDAAKDAESDDIETDNISDESAASKDTKPVKANNVARAKTASDTNVGSEPVDVIATGTYDSGLNWVLDSKGKLTISGTGESIDTVQPWYHYRNQVKSVDIQAGVTRIEMNAFVSCGNLTAITIPDSVTSIDQRAFSECTNLKSVYISSIEAWLGINFSNTSSNPLSNGADLYLNRKKVTSLQIPNSVTTVPDCAFVGCASLQSVTIPDGVTRVGERAFLNCSKLTNINISDSVTEIGKAALRGCSNLTSLTIPESVSSIGVYAFSDCSSLTSITLPCSVSEIGSFAFDGCSALKDCHISGGEEKWTIPINDGSIIFSM